MNNTQKRIAAAMALVAGVLIGVLLGFLSEPKAAEEAITKLQEKFHIRRED